METSSLKQLHYQQHLPSVATVAVQKAFEEEAPLLQVIFYFLSCIYNYIYIYYNHSGSKVHVLILLQILYFF